MDITYYFNKKSVNSNESKLREANEKQLRSNNNKFLSFIGSFQKDGIIDLFDYTCMVNFMKTGGTIVNLGQYNGVMDKINSKADKKDKVRFNKLCQRMFKHLYEMFGSKYNGDNILDKMQQFNEDDIQFTKDQRIAIRNICDFLYDPKLKTYGLYGYAGTGKTTLITKLIHFMLLNNYINSVVFAAPTNKAVNIMKSKFKNDIESLMKNKFKEDGSKTLNEQLDKLEEKGYKINFITIHKLLNFQNDFDADGERIFVKSDKSDISKFDLVVIDESSMIPFPIIAHIFDDLSKDEHIKKIPKVLFVGDPAQLPPVNEKVSIIFAKSSREFDLELFKKTMYEDCYFDSNPNDTLDKKFNILKDNIINQKSSTLEQVMRNDNNKVVGLCNNVREWVIGLIKQPKIGLFKGTKVKLYKYGGGSKLKTSWFKTCLEYFSDGNNTSNMSNIILTWTNKQCNEYNNSIRKMLFKRDKLSTFEVGDILILNDFYNIKETVIETVVETGVGKDDSKKKAKKFYTSEQIKIVKLEEVTKAISQFPENLNHLSYKNMNRFVEDKYKKAVKSINNNITRKYEVWKLYVRKLLDTSVDANHQPEIHVIFVIKDKDKEKLQKEKDMAAECIKELRKVYRIYMKDESEMIDREVIKPLWREWNKRFLEPFGNVNMAYCITTHKGQGSNYFNVFVDADDIFKNRNQNEAKRCIYTALTRSANELHILI